MQMQYLLGQDLSVLGQGSDCKRRERQTKEETLVIESSRTELQVERIRVPASSDSSALNEFGVIYRTPDFHPTSKSEKLCRYREVPSKAQDFQTSSTQRRWLKFQLSISAWYQAAPSTNCTRRLHRELILSRQNLSILYALVKIKGKMKKWRGSFERVTVLTAI